MGTLRSKTNHGGLTVNGILLGEPVILTADAQQLRPGDTMDAAWFSWDDSALPTGVLDADGNVTIDEVA